MLYNTNNSRIYTKPGLVAGASFELQQLVGQPVHGLVDARALLGRAQLQPPGVLLDFVQAVLRGDLLLAECPLCVLLVGQD